MRAKARLIKRLIKYRQLYAFLLLPLTYMVLFKYIPMLGTQIAFRNFNVRDGMWASQWIGVSQFARFFTSYQFQRVLTNTIRLSVLSLAIGFPVPVVFALLLNTIRDGALKKGIQTITYMPHFISTVVLVGIVMQVLNPLNGIYGRAAALFGLENTSDPMASPAAFPFIFVLSGVWQNFGWGSIIYMAALSNVSAELHEAAQIDGATRAQRMWRVDLPGILPTAIIMLILRTGQIMSVGFEKDFLMQNSLNLRASEIISTYVYKVSLGSTGKSDYSYATAIGLFNSVVNFIIITAVNRISARVSETSLW